MDFGVKVKVGNYKILKYAKSLSKQEVKNLRNAANIPAYIQKHLQRASLPYIKVSTITDSWAVEFVIGTTMYDALDELHVVHDAAGNHQLMGVEAHNTEAIFCAMFADTTTVGDFEYMVAKQKLLSEYLERAGKKLNEKQDAGKSEAELKEESDKAAQEVLDDEKNATMLKEMAEELKKEV